MRLPLILAAGLMLATAPLLAQGPPTDPTASPAATVAPGGPNAARPGCQPDPDLSGLVAALQGAAKKAAKDSLDQRMLEDAATALEARTRERAALCRRIADLLAIEASLEASLSLRARLVEIAHQDRDLYEREWEAALDRTTPPPRSCLWGEVLFGLGGVVVGMAADRE